MTLHTASCSYCSHVSLFKLVHLHYCVFVITPGEQQGAAAGALRVAPGIATHPWAKYMLMEGLEKVGAYARYKGLFAGQILAIAHALPCYDSWLAAAQQYAFLQQLSSTYSSSSMPCRKVALKYFSCWCTLWRDKHCCNYY